MAPKSFMLWLQHDLFVKVNIWVQLNDTYVYECQVKGLAEGFSLGVAQVARFTYRVLS